MPTRVNIKLTKAQRYTFIIIGVGLLIAAGIWFSFPKLGGFSIFSDIIIFTSLFIAISTLFGSGYFISRYMDYLINEKRFNAIIVGILCSLLILTLGILTGSSVMAFVYSHPSNSISKVLLDYYYFPLIIIFMVGGIPTIILGSILGKMIKN